MHYKPNFILYTMLKARKTSGVNSPMRYDPQLLSYVHLLRFGNNKNPDHSKPILNYQSIAKMIKLPVITVIILVKAAIDASRYMF